MANKTFRCIGYAKKLFDNQVLWKSVVQLSSLHKVSAGTFSRRYSGIPEIVDSSTFLSASNPQTEDSLSNCMLVYNNFITDTEEQALYDEVQSYLRRLRYEYDHWDNAIHGFRETEKSQWNEGNMVVLQRVRDVAFPPGTPQLAHVHVLDLEKNGYIKPHIDSVRFCGDTIAGLSLLSPSVMRLVHDEHKDLWADVLLQPRSLYIMTGIARYKYSHEILSESESKFRGTEVVRDRRISIICRNEPSVKDTQS